MRRLFQHALTRRALLASTGISAGLLFLLPLPSASHAASSSEFRLRAAPGRVRLLSEPDEETAVWCYNNSVPGPEIRVRQGDRVRIAVENVLNEETTVHWHGVRVPNAMDGVPYLTQQPIAQGATFTYEFEAVDAGTFWYHPHQRGFEQVGRGLYGPLIIEESRPLPVDRDITWVLDDWRLTPAGEISDDFGNWHDMNHDGRVGNTVTINGLVPDRFAVRRGERIRLRLINAANARMFKLDFADLEPLVIALDGQPVAPHRPDDGLIVLGPAMRIDLLLDCNGLAGSLTSVTDRFYEGLEYRLVDISYDAAPLRDRAPDWPAALPANGLPEPDIANAVRHEVTFNGGMMGEMVMQEMGGSMADSGSQNMMDSMHSANVWFINGVAATGHILDPMLTLQLGQPCVIAMTNATAWYHPIHLHGHSFRVLSRNGQPTRYREWQDTVLMAPRERVEIAFVADNPGDWMFHCHILEHMAGGMMGVIRVA